MLRFVKMNRSIDACGRACHPVARGSYNAKKGSSGLTDTFGVLYSELLCGRASLSSVLHAAILRFASFSALPMRLGAWRATIAAV